MGASHPWIITQITHPRYARISAAEERALFLAYRAGDPKAERKIVNANLRFVIQVAFKYVNKGVDLEDLIAEGLLGMQRALPRFDTTTGFKFISYAVWWIRQAMMTALAEQGRNVRLPQNMLAAFTKLTRELRRLTGELKRPPTPEELAEAGRVKLDVANDYFRYCVPEISLDFKDPEEEGIEIAILDEGPRPDAKHEERKAKAYQTSLLKDLKPVERDVLLRYHGLTNQGEQTLEEIGVSMDLTRERIRQIKDKALEKARARARTIKVKERVDLATVKSKRRRGPVSIGEARRV